MIPFLYGSICLIWGSTWLAIKIGLIGVPPFLAAGLRFLIATSILFTVVLFQRRKLHLSKEAKICVLSCGVLSFSVSYACVYWSEQYISSGLTAIFYSTMPLSVALLSHFWTKTETLNARKVAGIVIGMAGTIILFWPHESISWIKFAAMGSALSSTVAASVNLVTLKKYARHIDVYILNAYGMAIGAFSLLTLSLLTESYRNLAWGRSNISAIVYLAIFGSVMAFLAYYSLVKMIDATSLSLITLIFPIIALILGWMFLGETVSPSAGIGIFGILVGVAVAGGIWDRSAKRAIVQTPAP